MNGPRHHIDDTVPTASDAGRSQAPPGDRSCAAGASQTERPAGTGPRIEEEIAQLIFGLGQRFRAHVGALLTQLDLTLPQAWLLMSLDGPLPMGEVASRVRADPSTITWLVDRLEARGLLERRPHPSDRRVKHLVLTAQGERLREWLHAVFADVPGLSALSPSQLQTLRDLLRQAVGGCA